MATTIEKPTCRSWLQLLFAEATSLALCLNYGSNGEQSMSLMFHYFGATDADAARGIDPWAPNDAQSVVEANVAEPFVVVGNLLAIVSGKPWTPDLTGGTLISPLATHESQFQAGPWLFELSLWTCDVLADIDGSKYSEIAIKWSRIDELGGIDTALLAEMIKNLSALAKRARSANQRLYCWISM
jgi:hypothetical protein